MGDTSSTLDSTWMRTFHVFQGDYILFYGPISIIVLYYFDRHIFL